MKAAHHGGEDLERGGVTGELVGVGKKIAFEGGWGWTVGGPGGDEFGVLALGCEEGVAGAEAGGLDCLSDVEDVEAFGDGEGAGVDVAVGDVVGGVGHGELGVEALLACLEAAPFGEAEEIEAVTTADDAAALELGGDGLGAGAGG